MKEPPLQDDSPPQVTSGKPSIPSQGRIFGLETEYAVLYQPDDPEDPQAPPFSLIEEVLFESILLGRKAARSSGLKGGYFLENGGLVHLEIFLRHQADTPILEVATPECASPEDLVVYQRAFDRILATASDRSWKELRNRGHKGRILFGKNNLDFRGTGYGCHENYLVRFHPTWSDKLLVFLALPFLLLFATPWLIMVVALVFLFVGVILVGSLFGFVSNLFPAVFRKFIDKLGNTSRGFFDRLPKSALECLRMFFYYFANLLLLPVIFVYNLLLKTIGYRPFLRDLTPFLITRQIMTGAGALNPRTGRFELSQRAQLTKSVSKIIMFGRYKTMYDLKSFLYHPLELFKDSRKLTLSLGDSNLSDIPNLLKAGTSSLVLKMIESGVSFSDLHVRRPVKAFRQISLGGPWKEIGLKHKKHPKRTAIEIQREYLRRAKEFFSDERNAVTFDSQEILTLWETILQGLEDNAVELSAQLDWAAKKSLLDEAVLSTTNWKRFSSWTPVFCKLPAADLWASTTESSDPSLRMDEILARCGSWRRWAIRRHLRRHGLDPRDGESMLQLYFQCRKIDLRFHEIGCDPGYQRQLESERLIERLTLDEVVQRAMRDPPSGTRARVRGYYIKLSPTRKSIRANWSEVHLAGTNQTISLRDPFYSTIPTD